MRKKSVVFERKFVKSFGGHCGTFVGVSKILEVIVIVNKTSCWWN